LYLAILTNIGNATRIIRHINGPRNSKDQKIVKSGASPRSKNLPALEPINAKTNPPGIIPKNVVHKKFFKLTPAIAGKILAIKKGTTGINRRSKRIFTSLTLSCSTKILNLTELFSNLLKKFLKPNLTAKNRSVAPRVADTIFNIKPTLSPNRNPPVIERTVAPGMEKVTTEI
jgi:hypothetical protein